MRVRFALILGIIVLAGCNLSVPNGLFGCGQPTDCPSGYFCWSSDSRCYDSKEPQCVSRTCEEVIADFASLGIPIECGSLPDGCDGSIECGGCQPGEACGANGQNFICGCEENSCANFQGGAECGAIPTRCGGDEQAVFCGACLGEQVCVDNRCVCPPESNCDQGCGDSCGPDEVCVEGECCEPAYPCAENECSPPTGLPNGCGGIAHCPSCGDDEDCVLSNDLVFQCLGDCTCEAQGVECGNATICGDPTLCGSCQDNGFEDGYRCQSGLCVCQDPFEPNNSFDKATLLCGSGAGTNCMQDVWGMEVQATLHRADDIDNYELRVLDVATPLIAQIYGGQRERILFMTYLCPDGKEGMKDCSGWEEEIQDVKFCLTSEQTIGIARSCDSGSSGGPEGAVGTVLVGVTSNQQEAECDPYELHIFATYQPEIPLGF